LHQKLILLMKVGSKNKEKILINTAVADVGL